MVKSSLIEIQVFIKKSNWNEFMWMQFNVLSRRWTWNVMEWNLMWLWTSIRLEICLLACDLINVRYCHSMVIAHIVGTYRKIFSQGQNSRGLIENIYWLPLLCGRYLEIFWTTQYYVGNFGWNIETADTELSFLSMSIGVFPVLWFIAFLKLQWSNFKSIIPR